MCERPTQTAHTITYHHTHTLTHTGGIYNNGTSPVFVMNCDFLSNIAKLNGGAIAVSGEGTVNNSNFIQNTANDQGGNHNIALQQ